MDLAEPNDLASLRRILKVHEIEDLVRHFDGKPGGRPYAWDGIRWREIPNQLWENLAEEILAKSGKLGNTRSEVRAKIKEIKELRTVLKMNFESAHLLVLRDGKVLDLKKKVEDPEGRWLLDAAEVKRHLITAKAGVAYRPSRQTFDIPLHDLIAERTGDPEVFDFVMTFLAGTLYGVPRVKGVLEIFNLRRNTGKTAFMKVLAKIYGDYAVKMSTHLLTPGLQHHADQFLYRKRFARVITMDETDESTALNERLVKAITGRDTFQVPYKTALEDDFLVEAKLILDSNNLVRPQFEESTIADRTFIVPWGKPYRADDRVASFEDTFADQQKLDEFFAVLVDVYFPKWWKLTSFEREGRMAITHEMFLLNANPSKTFLERCCHIGKEAYEKIGSRHTISEVYRFFTRWLKNYQLHLIKALGMDYDDFGNPMSDAQLLAEAKIPTQSDFKQVLDRVLGQATRMNSGLVWKNLVVHPVLIVNITSSSVDDFIPGFSRMMDIIDKTRSTLFHMQDVSQQIETVNTITEEGRLKVEDLIVPPNNPQALLEAMAALSLMLSSNTADS